jgi:hypothetical protein
LLLLEEEEEEEEPAPPDDVPEPRILPPRKKTGWSSR